MLLQKIKIISFSLVFIFSCQVATVIAAEQLKPMKVIIDEVFTYADKQSTPLAKAVFQQEGQVPRATDSAGKLITSGAEWWTSGFFPGTLWYIYEYTKDPVITTM
jgi:unsaturated chondroitin disaccharide hydrolase